MAQFTFNQNKFIYHLVVNDFRKQLKIFFIVYSFFQSNQLNW